MTRTNVKTAKKQSGKSKKKAGKADRPSSGRKRAGAQKRYGKKPSGKRGSGITEANKAAAVNDAMLAVEAAKKAKSAKNTGEKRSSGLDAAAEVLAEAKKPLTTREMVERMLAKGLWRTNGKTPAATIYTAVTMLPKAA